MSQIPTYDQLYMTLLELGLNPDEFIQCEPKAKTPFMLGFIDAVKNRVKGGKA